MGDFNGDGKPDLASANYDDNTVSVTLGNGHGAFGAPANYPVGANPRGLVIADFNLDKKTDLAVIIYGSGTVSVVLGNVDGTFQAAVNYAVGARPSSVAVGDFNHDGKPDLAVANDGFCRAASTVSILLGDGDGTFLPIMNHTVGSAPLSVVIGDFNRDGKPDLAVANTGSNNISVLLGRGDGTFQPPVNYNLGIAPFSLAVGDFNRDLRPDLFAVVNNYVVILQAGATEPSGSHFTHLRRVRSPGL